MGKKELFFLLSFTLSVRRTFHFLCMLEKGCVILLCHSLGMPYDYFAINHEKNACKITSVICTCSAASLMNCLAASDHIAGTVNTQSTSDVLSSPEIVSPPNLIMLSARYPIERENTAMADKDFPISSFISKSRLMV